MKPKLRLPKKHMVGIKIYCPLQSCKRDNPKCRHYESHVFRVRFHVPGTKNSVRSRELGRDYDEAEKGAVAFKEELKANNYASAKVVHVAKEEAAPKDFSIPSVALMFFRHLAGGHPLRHKRIEAVSKSHQESYMRFVGYFFDILKQRGDVERMRMDDVTEADVSAFYAHMEAGYSPRYFNQCMDALQRFFAFAVDEGNATENPFKGVTSKTVAKPIVKTLTKKEFGRILEAIRKDAEAPAKNGAEYLYRPYLETAYLLGLYTGLRREELVELRWSDIQTHGNVSFFVVKNLKVERSSKKEAPPKYVPIGKDLADLLDSLGYAKLKDTDGYVFHPDRTEQSFTICKLITRAFSFYRKKAKIEKDVTFKHLRKTYLTWTDAAMGEDTGLLSSHSSREVLTNHYLDPKILSTIKKAALSVKVFGD